MTPLAHVSYTTPLTALIAWQAGPEPAACFTFGAILIDVDHFIFFVLRTGRYSPLEMLAWFRKNDKQCTANSYYGLNIFHAVETFMLVAIAASYWPVLSWLLLGMGFHLLLDLIWLYAHPVLSLQVRALSWTEHFLRRNRGEVEFWRKP